jgi:hypothetical protein
MSTTEPGRMTAEEAGQLLAFAALYDNRKVSDPDVMACLKAIGDLPYADAEAAIAEHYGSGTERVMYGHIRDRVKAMRLRRLERTPLPAPPADATETGRYQEIIRANIERIADGKQLRNAIGGGAPLPGDPPAEWQQAREAMAGPAPVKPDPREVAAEQVREAAEQRARREAGERAS